MATTRKSVLTVALDAETFERIGPILKRSTLSVQAASMAAEALVQALRDRYHLIVCRYPLPDMHLREFVTAIRAKGSASRGASLLLLTIPEMRSEARSGISGGPFLVFSQQESIANLHEGAAHLLHVAPRHKQRIPARLRVNLEHESMMIEAWIVNISATGMLVTEVPRLPVGARCLFEFELPESGFLVSGSCDVVRHTNRKRERVDGLGFRFVDFRPGCHEALDAWCESKLAS